VIRGDLSTREFIAFWMHDRRVLAGLTVNIWDVTGSIEHIIKSRAEVDSTGWPTQTSQWTTS
jgi:3-phenylpropionate/trans-cinnamate dioxygenase ferredoxin reductase subunit